MTTASDGPLAGDVASLGLAGAAAIALANAEAPWFGLLAVPLAWLGFHPAMIAICGGFNLIYQF